MQHSCASQASSQTKHACAGAGGVGGGCRAARDGSTGITPCNTAAPPKLAVKPSTHVLVQAPLVGDAGQTFVTETLGSEKPQKAIQLIQQAAALQDPRTKPLLSLLDHLGVSRCGALSSSDLECPCMFCSFLSVFLGGGEGLVRGGGCCQSYGSPRSRRAHQGHFWCEFGPKLLYQPIAAHGTLPRAG